MQQINKQAKAMSGNEYAELKREERKKHKALREQKKGRKWQWAD